ncbi:MAG: endonuclease/exonuclease/phosphatase family protein [Pirellulaceae bacterium]
MTRLRLTNIFVAMLVVMPHLAILNAGEQAANRAALTVLNYNVFNGFRGGKSYDDAVQWINEVKPDIAGWQELVGWNEARLQKAAEDWDHPYAATLKSGGYNIGLSSRYEIEVIKRQTTGFWHGYLHCRTAGLDVIVCHLWPGSRRGQLKEATILRDLVVQLHKDGRQVLLMGDFNAHSASDKNWIDRQQPLIDRRAPADMKRAPEDRFIVDGRWNFDVMMRIFESSLIDPVRIQFEREFKTPAADQQRLLGSFPTRVLNHVSTSELQSGFLERIDFILATPELAKKCVNARVVRDVEILESTSDHYPVIVEIKP